MESKPLSDKINNYPITVIAKAIIKTDVKQALKEFKEEILKIEQQPSQEHFLFKLGEVVKKHFGELVE